MPAPVSSNRHAPSGLPPACWHWPRFVLLCLAFLATGPLARAQEPKIRVLIVEGLSNHDWRHRVEIVRAVLARDGSFDVDVTVTPSVAGDPAWATWRPNFAAYDVVLSGYNDLNVSGGLPWPAEVRTAFEQYVSGGGGFHAYHEANNAFATWTEYQRMLGLGWRNANDGSAIIVNADESLQILAPGSGPATSHGNRVNVEVKRRGNHAILAGLPLSWMAADLEIYRYARGPAENLTVLSYALDPTTQLRFPIDWVVQYGQGRCYASSYGHVWSDQTQPAGARCAAFQTMLVRALKWLAKRDPGTAVPADFPSPAAVSLRPYESGVSGLDQAQAVGAFANGMLPATSTPTGSVLVERAFPNLAWESPIEAKPWPGSTDLLIAETDGRIYRVPDNDATTTRSLVLDIQSRVWYQNWVSNDSTTKHGGMQSVVFHPRFGTGEGKDHIYVFYLHHPTDNPAAAPPYYDRLARFAWDPGTASFNPASELIMINQYDTEKGHDGGGMAFGSDGFLHIAFGDEGIQGTGATPYTQLLNSRVRSGVWRLDVDQQGGTISHPIRRQPYNITPLNPDPLLRSYTQGYHVPNTNPWQDPGGGTLEEYYAIGLRQPHRMSFDPVTGFFWIGDVGHGTREEVDVLDAPGLNFQWNYKEGTANGFRAAPSPLIGIERGPAFDYSHSGADSLGNCVIGGHVYRGNALPWLHGRYLFGDNGSQRVFALEYDAATRQTLSVTQVCTGRGGTIWTGISSFGQDSQGEPLLLQMGAGAANGGRISRLKPDPGTPDPSQFPATLSATGLFSPLANLTPAPGMIPYDINMPLWSAGTDKQRWMLIPNDGVPDTSAERITYSETGVWSLPAGSALVKHFALPNGGRRLETRVLVRGNDGGWGGVTYKWRADQLDADRLEEGAAEELTIDGETFSYLYPARSQCATCHTAAAGGILGLRTRQLNCRLRYSSTGRDANQIETLAKLGFITPMVSEVGLLPVLTSARRDDPAVSDEHFVRSYLDGNCAHCHHPGGTRASFDARLTTAPGEQNLLCGSVFDTLGISGAAVLKPGRIFDSVMFHRMNTLAEGISMPPLAKGRIDPLAVVALANWISSLDADSCAPVVPTGPAVSAGNGAVPGASPIADGWESNMVINETDTYTNSTGAPQVISLSRFQFYATRVTATPLTPFVVRVNGDNQFTVLAVGTTHTAYLTGVNDLPFSTAAAQLTLAAGEKIAMGFLDAYPDGTGSAGAGVIAFNTAAGADQIHYSGSTVSTQSGRVTVGQAPVFGSTVYTTFGRNYFYAITFLPGDGSGSNGDTDDDGLPDSWELAVAPSLTALSSTDDADGDGKSDADERRAGTDPLDAASLFQIRELHPQPGVSGVSVVFDSVPGRSYRISISADLTVWSDAGTLRSADWPAAQTTFTIDAANFPPGGLKKCFVRLAVERTSP